MKMRFSNKNAGIFQCPLVRERIGNGGIGAHCRCSLIQKGGGEGALIHDDKRNISSLKSP